jgi:hypothetical protein
MLEVRGWNPSTAKILFSSPITSKSAPGSTETPIQYRNSFPGVERPVREVNGSLPPNAEVKSVCLHGVDRGQLYLYIRDK